MSKDYYNLLGVDKNASKDEIKKAFRKLAHEHHPDKGSGNIDKFKEINEAYQVLSNEDKRHQYDQFGSSGPFGFDGARANNGQGGFGGSQGFSGGINMDDLSDMFGGGFGDIFGGSRRKSGPQRGRDIESSMNISFDDSYYGAEKTIQLRKAIVCEHCKGDGAEPGAKIDKCKTCNGSGKIRQVRNSIFGQMATVGMCSDCDGEGETPSQKCTKCNGQGLSEGIEQIKVKIPAGIGNDQSLKMSGKGEAGSKGAAAGDLYISLRVSPSNKFKREGENLFVTIPISITQATLGDKVAVQTVENEVKLKIPAGTKSGKQFIIRGKGMPKLGGRGYGNLYVEVDISIPNKLTRDQKKLLEKLQKEGL
ncbi:molecular chaperone DnaJ [Patescibacteria group bacterium]|nr:molecular chaperone DnaJ [Patescibacteria group bacterium]